MKKITSLITLIIILFIFNFCQEVTVCEKAWQKRFKHSGQEKDYFIKQCQRWENVFDKYINMNPNNETYKKELENFKNCAINKAETFNDIYDCSSHPDMRVFWLDLHYDFFPQQSQPQP